MTEHVIHAGSTFTLELRTFSEVTGSVVLKYPTSLLPEPKVLNRLEREFEIGSSLNLPLVRRVYKRYELNGWPAVALEYIHGESFKSYFNKPNNRSLQKVLKLALGAVTALDSLHSAEVVHRDLAPSNLMVEENSERVLIIDLEFATWSSEERNFVFSAKGQLPYLSPEQSGRIALPVDKRSDLYAFGVVLYEMLTGKHPFQAEDAAGWIHAHLARQPDPPHYHLPSIPKVVSDIVLRLLAKAPEHRYQTARGLRHDLVECLSRLDRDGAITDFTLGRSDHAGRLSYPSTLYGRKPEQQRLKTALEQAVKGQPRLEFISGYAGVGKTVLVNELRFPVAAVGGHFICGKFDQTVKAIPYAAFIESFSQYCHMLLGCTPAELKSFRERVLVTVGANAGLLLEHVSELEAIIGLQPPSPSLDTVASANRFAVTLLGFFTCLVSAEHPLVLFLDDLQWADSASLELLHMIAARAVSSHFLIICAYRDKELPSEHPLSALIDKIKQEGLYVGETTLGGLSLGMSTDLIAGALDSPSTKVAPLAELIHAKTDGNPFFMLQLLETLVSEKALHFAPQSNTWCWKTDRVKTLDISNNVIKLMLHKIARVPAYVRLSLQAASCIGSRFSFELLAVAASHSVSELKKWLAPAVKDGLVAMLGDAACFTHDRIQQAVYQTLEPKEAQRIHLRIGRHLIEERYEHDLPHVAVRQLNYGSDLIDSDSERRRLAELNLEAGRTASAAMAYGEARDFYATGEGLLDPSVPSEKSLLYELRLRRAEASFITGAVADSIQSLRELLQDTSDISFRVRIYQMLIDIHTVKLQPDKALAMGREALTWLGITIPQGQPTDSFVASVNEIDLILSERDIECIADWPEMRDERELAIAGLMTHLVVPAYISAAEEFPFLAMEFVRRTLQGGLSRFSSMAFCVYGMLLAGVLGRYESAHLMGKLGTEIALRPDGVGLCARANFFHALFIVHWREPLEAALPYLEKGWKVGVETGDLQVAAYSINHIHGNGLISGQSLIELEQSLGQFSEVTRIIRQEEAQQGFSMSERLVEALRYPVDTEKLPDILIDHGGAATVLETWSKIGNTSLLCVYHLMNCLFAVIMEKPAEARLAMEQVGPHLSGISGWTWLPLHHFLQVLVQVDTVRDGDLESNPVLMRIDGIRKCMEGWAKACSANYLHKLLLVEAEIADLAGEDQSVMLEAYDRAIDAATHAGHTLDLALACERAAGYWKRSGKLHFTRLYLQRALQAYESWGAGAKVAQMKRTWANLQMPLQFQESEAGHASASSSSSDELHAVDIYSVLKAAQTVAGELVIDRMLARLIGLVIETAGAQSGYLLLERRGEWHVVAEQRPDRKAVEVLQWRLLDAYPEIAASVVQYVARTQKVVSLDDAAMSALFAADSSIVERCCKSLLCLPIINRGELDGILYLENNLATYAFTRTHTRIIQLLTTQAISSLEISRYYARVQSLNRSLEEEIEERKHTESKLEYLANHDPLTNLPNRRLFYDRVKHSIQRAQRHGYQVVVFFLDLDQFKNINDTLSHQVGDHLLQLVAQRLSTHVREEDTLGRIGGDEYVLLMEGRFNPHDLSIIAEKLLDTFCETVIVDGHELHPTGCLGISLFPDDAADADQLLRNADVAMYTAKRCGRNKYQFFSANLAEVASERLTLEKDLRQAIVRQELKLYFQPQIDLESGSITGAETLLRWCHPTRGLMLPQSFIPLAEEIGCIVDLGEWVLQTACQQLKLWQREGIQLGSLAVNVSSRQFSPHSDLTAQVKQVLEDSDINPAILELELTESVIMQDSESAMHSLATLNGLGVRLAIDDFGTGYSSLSYLHRLPVQRLKIDRSFVSNLPHTYDSAMIVQSIMLLGRNLGKQIIAEGIENMEQKRFLKEAGCVEGQGYLFGAPMPSPDFLKLLKKGSVI